MLKLFRQIDRLLRQGVVRPQRSARRVSAWNSSAKPWHCRPRISSKAGENTAANGVVRIIFFRVTPCAAWSGLIAEASP